MTHEKEQIRTQLRDALMYLCVPEESEAAIKNLSEQEEKYNKTYFSKKGAFRRVQFASWGIGMGATFASAGLCLSFILVLFGRNIHSLIVPIVLYPVFFFIFAIISSICVMLFQFFVSKKYTGKAKQYWDEVASPAIIKIRQQIREIEGERDRFLNEYAYVLDFLPEDYRDVMAVGYMEECIRNLRADTLKEAINLYEEQKHRWTLENLSRQMLAETELHNQIMQAGFQAIYDEQRRTTAMATNIRNLTLFNTMRDIHKEIKSN